MDLAKLVQRLFLSVSLIVITPCCSPEITPQARIIAQKQEGYDKPALNYFKTMGIPTEKSSPYLTLYKKYNLLPFQIGDFNNKDIPPEFAERALALGYMAGDLEYITKINLEEGIKFKKQGFSAWEIVRFVEDKVPLEYVLAKRDLLKSSYELSKMYHSSIRDEIISQKSTLEIYQQNIFYQDFSKIKINKSPDRIAIPGDIARQILIGDLIVQFEDTKRFEREVFLEAEKLGYTREKIRLLDPRDSVEAAVKIVASRMTWEDVDNEKTDFFKKNGRLSVDNYFYLGLGDCDKYSFLTSAVFRILKTQSGIENAHVLPFSLGGNSGLKHAWNTVVFIEKDKITFSDIDVVQYDTKNNMDATSGHLDKDNYIQRAFGDKYKSPGR